MAYIVTPDLGLQLADPATVQPFETPNVNGNFLTLEAGIVADRVRLAAIEGNLKRVTDLDALAALSTAGVGAGSMVEVGELRALFMRNFANTAWEQVTAARFATTAARDTAYAKAAGAYLVGGAEVYRTDMGWVERYFAANTFGVTTAGWCPVSGALPAFIAPITVGTTLSDAAFTQLGISSPTLNHGMTSLGGNVLTIAQTGLYDLSVAAEMAVSGAAVRMGVAINRNSATQATNTILEVVYNSQNSAGAATQERLVAGDQLRFWCFQARGGTSTTQAGGGQLATAVYLRPA